MSKPRDQKSIQLVKARDEKQAAIDKKEAEREKAERDKQFKAEQKLKAKQQKAGKLSLRAGAAQIVREKIAKRKKKSEAAEKLLDIVDPKAKQQKELFLPEDDDEGYESEEYYDVKAKAFKKKPFQG